MRFLTVHHVHEHHGDVTVDVKHAMTEPGPDPVLAKLEQLASAVAALTEEIRAERAERAELEALRRTLAAPTEALADAQRGAEHPNP